MSSSSPAISGMPMARRWPLIVIWSTALLLALETDAGACAADGGSRCCGRCFVGLVLALSFVLFFAAA